MQKVVGTERSDYPNQISNILAFPGIFRSRFGRRAGISTVSEMKELQRREAIASLIISEEELGPEYIIPAAFDPRVGEAVARAVAKAARESGTARI